MSVIFWIFWGRSEDDVPFRGQRTDFGIRNRCEVGDDQCRRLRRLRLNEKEILLIAWIALYVQLRRQHPRAALIDRIGNVRSTFDILCRLDRAEVIFTRRARQKTTETLEVRVLVFVATVAVGVSTFGVHLPDLNQGIANRFTG